MILDLIAIVLIILLSFILCMNDNNYRCQLSHIVIGLSVIVFYKLAKYFNYMPVYEPMTDNLTNSINDFISATSVNNSILTNEQAKSLSPSDLSAYNDKLNQLINILNDIKNQQSAPQSNIAVSPETLQKLDFDSQQQYQMFQIDYLNKQLQNAKDIINSQTIANSSTNYKPIKVYSSCVISNTDGSTTQDKSILHPINAQNQQILQSTGQMPSSQSTTATQSNFLNLSPSTGIFGNILNNLAKGHNGHYGNNGNIITNVNI